MSQPTCVHDGCDKPVYVKSRGLCRPHYKRWWTAQHDRQCSIEGCGSRHEARGYCNMHYQRWRLHGDPLYVAPLEPPRFCEADGCDRQVYAVGLCEPHYARRRRHGGLHDQRIARTPLAERFWPKVHKTDGCWLWQGGVNGSGYGSIGLGGAGSTIGAHVAAVILDGREVPDGMEIDHLCVTPLCVRPDHLDIVIRAENERRKRLRTRQAS